MTSERGGGIGSVIDDDDDECNKCSTHVWEEAVVVVVVVVAASAQAGNCISFTPKELRRQSRLLLLLSTATWPLSPASEMHGSAEGRTSFSGSDCCAV